MTEECLLWRSFEVLVYGDSAGLNVAFFSLLGLTDRGKKNLMEDVRKQIRHVLPLTSEFSFLLDVPTFVLTHEAITCDNVGQKKSKNNLFKSVLLLFS